MNSACSVRGITARRRIDGSSIESSANGAGESPKFTPVTANALIPAPTHLGPGFDALGSYVIFMSHVDSLHYDSTGTAIIAAYTVGNLTPATKCRRRDAIELDAKQCDVNIDHDLPR
jgi:hypothetical protein